MMTADQRAEQRAKRDEALAKRRDWKPTPTQEENDLVAMGVLANEVGKRDNGSVSDPHVERAREQWKFEERRDMRPKRDPRGEYETR